MNLYGNHVCILLLTVFLGFVQGELPSILSNVACISKVTKCDNTWLRPDVEHKSPPAALCKKLPAIQSCFSKTAAKFCSENAPILQTYRTMMEERQNKCNSGGEIENGGGLGDRKRRATKRYSALLCSNEVIKCANAMTRLIMNKSHPSERCRKLPPIVACFTKASTHCSEDDKNLRRHLITLRKRQKICNSGEGLKSNIGGLLLATMLFVVRHFL